MLFVTGDTHGFIDIGKLGNKKFPINKELSKEDYVIIAGDFGLIWNGDKQDMYWLNWLKERNFTTLFVDGNHENFDLISQYPIKWWNGGKVHIINESVIHLMRGQVFNISGLNIFTFGGANSSDKEFRKEGTSWWKQEMPTEEEYNEGIVNLEKCNWQVDYIITHTCPTSILEKVKRDYGKTKEITRINDYFESIRNRANFKYWFSGHDHLDIDIQKNHIILYQELVRIDKNATATNPYYT